MNKVYCPKCGKALIRLEPYDDDDTTYDFWCDTCNLDITIVDNKQNKKEID